MTSALQTSAVAPSVASSMDLYRQMDAVRNALAPDLTDIELQLFAMVAQQHELDPFLRQIHAVKRQGRVTFQTGIDGYRSMAERTGEYDGSDEPEFGPIVDKPFPHPEWSRVTVYRRRADGSRRAQSATARWDEFYPGDGQGHMWRKMPHNQLSKCAEALSFRKAFPKTFANVYTDDEMEQADRVAAATPVTPPASAVERIAARRAGVEAARPVNEQVVAEAVPPATEAAPSGNGTASQAEPVGPPIPAGSAASAQVRRVGPPLAASHPDAEPPDDLPGQPQLFEGQ